jgi:hypothetical protein
VAGVRALWMGTTDFEPGPTSRIVAWPLARRTAAGNRSSCEKTITLSVDGEFVKDSDQPLDLRRVHRLHRVVQHDESERTLKRRGARQEQG